VPEIIARLVSGHGYGIPDSWVFAWRNGALTLISPTAAAHALQVTLLSQIAAVDLDGSGKLSLLAFPGVHRDDSGNLVANGDIQVYAFSNGKIVPTTTALSYAEAFYRRTGGPAAKIANFAATPGRKILRFVNGVNVAGPSNFKSKTRVIDIPVQLAAQNRLEVELAGKPGNGIWVMVVNQ
jgi:hypothetical protein